MVLQGGSTGKCRRHVQFGRRAVQRRWRICQRQSLIRMVPARQRSRMRESSGGCTKSGDDDAQFALALALLDGKGVPQDVDEGQHWCKEVLKRNAMFGEYCKGHMYQNGLGVSRDDAKARTWYVRAAEGQLTVAIRALAAMEARGEGGKVDHVGACVQYGRLAAKGDKESLQAILNLKGQMTPGEWQKALKVLA